MSKLKMNFAIHESVGRISAEEVEMDEPLRDGLFCEYCNVPLTFVDTHVRREKQILGYFRLRKGFGSHNLLEGGDSCIYEKTNDNVSEAIATKPRGSISEEDLLIRINIPVDLRKSLEEVLSKEFIKEHKKVKKSEKRSPTIIRKESSEKNDYINSAKALAKIARYFEKGSTNPFIEFKFFGVTSNWMDLYHENWDKLYAKYSSSFPKELVCMRGKVSSIKQMVVIDNVEWVPIWLKLYPISNRQGSKSETFAKIDLFKPMFERFIKQLEKDLSNSKEIVITFFGNIERYENKKNGSKTVRGIAAFRRQVHYDIVK